MKREPSVRLSSDFRERKGRRFGKRIMGWDGEKLILFRLWAIPGQQLTRKTKSGIILYTFIFPTCSNITYLVDWQRLVNINVNILIKCIKDQNIQVCMSSSVIKGLKTIYKNLQYSTLIRQFSWEERSKSVWYVWVDIKLRVWLVNYSI